MTGQEAEEKYKKFIPHIILLDVKLPDTDGYTLCEKLRKCDLPDKYQPIIILISGYAMQEDKDRGLTAGANYYLSKPYDSDQLMKVIETIK